jgi:hypothetical protein
MKITDLNQKLGQCDRFIYKTVSNLNLNSFFNRHKIIINKYIG